MKKFLIILGGAGLAMIAAGAFLFSAGLAAEEPGQSGLTLVPALQRRLVYDRPFEISVLVGGIPIEEHSARGRTYVEAREGAEYEVRIRNPLPYRVAVALSVDGLNSIDARRTTAWNASKWVIGPYETIHIGGWQMSSERARRFYFTTERDSYAAKLGQTSYLGLITAVFFRERRPIPVPIAPPPRPPRPLYEEDSARDRRSNSPSASSEAQGAARQKTESIAPAADDEYAATGIGRSVRNDVRWVNLDLDSHPAAEVTLRYEFYPALVRLGIIPRQYPRHDNLRRRENSTGFDDRRFSPEP